MLHLVLGVAVVAQTTEPSNYAAHTVSPGLVGFLLFAGLGLATVLLWKSMTRHLRKLDFPAEAEVKLEERSGDPGGPSRDQGGSTEAFLDLTDRGPAGPGR